MTIEGSHMTALYTCLVISLSGTMWVPPIILSDIKIGDLGNWNEGCSDDRSFEVIKGECKT